MNKKILTLIAATLLSVIQACDSGNNSNDSESSSSSPALSSASEAQYVTDTAVVDYKGLNQVVYYDFSSGKKTVLPHDTWHIAFSRDLNIVANGGNYGFGVAACSTGLTDFSKDLSGWKDSTTRFTRTDTNSNVLGQTYHQAGVLTQQVYLAKLESGEFYKFQVTGILSGNTGLKIKIGALNADAATDIEFKMATEYGYTFIDLVNQKMVVVEPPKDQWDIRFGRTEFLMGKNTSGRSSIGINSEGGVTAAAITGTGEMDMGSVTEIPGATEFSSTPLAIGSQWVSYSSETKVFTMQPVIFVVRTTEGHYAKMRLLNFMGPNNEYYYSLFKYLYQMDGANGFEK